LCAGMQTVKRDADACMGYSIAEQTTCDNHEFVTNSYGRVQLGDVRNDCVTTFTYLDNNYFSRCTFQSVQ